MEELLTKNKEVKDSEEDKRWCVYMHINKINDKKYIGMTCQNVSERWGIDGKQYLRKNSNGEYMHPAFALALEKYNDWNNDWDHVVVADNLNKNEAIKMEIELINLYKTNICKWKNEAQGYNLTDGGEGHEISDKQREQFSIMYSGEGNPFYGQHHTQETKNLLREKRTGTKVSEETRQKLSKINKKRMEDPENRAACGKPHTDEWKENMSKRMSRENHPMYGKHLSDETKKKIGDAHRGTQVSESTKQKLRDAMSGKNNPMYGKQHTQETKDKISKANRGRKMSEDTLQKIRDSKPKGADSPLAKAVVQFDKNGNFIREWPYIQLAAQELNIVSSHISGCCKNKKGRKTAGGFIWKYKSDVENESDAIQNN